jgi:5-methylthioadenosine/S-adenosylhomocysteine deaminase
MNPWCNPIRTENLITNIVFNSNGSDVTDVFVDGRHVMEDRQVKTVDVPAIMQETNERANRIWSELSKTW